MEVRGVLYKIGMVLVTCRSYPIMNHPPLCSRRLCLEHVPIASCWKSAPSCHVELNVELPMVAERYSGTLVQGKLAKG